jgi:adenylylsulfate kinase
MIIHFIGQPGSGKTTLAKKTIEFIGSIGMLYKSQAVLIDGDELREIFSNKDYSEEGRRRNLTNAYNIARFLEAKGFTPVISMVSPYRDLREQLKKDSDVLEIYLTTSETRGRENFFVKDFEKPESQFIDIDTGKSLNECLEQIYDSVVQKTIAIPMP